MTDEAESRPWEELHQIAKGGDAGQLEEYIEALPAGETARAFSRLDQRDQAKVLTTLEPEHAANVIEGIPEAQAIELLERLSAPEAAAIVSELESDQQADLVGALGAADAEAVLAEMSRDTAWDVRRLASYPPDVAGGLMVAEFLAYPHTTPLRDVADDLRDRAEQYAAYVVQYVYAISSQGKLVGVLRLRDLLFSRRERTVADVMIRKPVSVPETASLDDLADFFDRHPFFGAPVIDGAGRLVGVIRRQDVEQALAGRSDQDYLKSMGIVGGEELRTMRLGVRAARRLSWLSVNILLNVLAAGVIAFYQDTLAAVIALAVFLPIISDMSGCSGNQAVAVTIRELTLGLVRPQDLMYVLLKELSVGLVNGIVLGAIIAGVAVLWKGNPYFGLVVGVALSLNTVVAVCVGGTIPLVLRRLGRDPALASGPILTTITDMCGFFLALSLATTLLPRLT